MKRSTVLDVLAAVAIALGVGLLVFAFLGWVAGVGAGVLVLGLLRALVSVWNARS